MEELKKTASDRPLALVLADELAMYATGDEFQRATEGAADELRRLHAVETAPRGTDAQIRKEREIASHAMVGAIAAGYNGNNPPEHADDLWLAAAHEAGQRLRALEQERDALAAEVERLRGAVRDEPVAWLLNGTQTVEFDWMPYHNGQEWSPLYADQQPPSAVPQLTSNPEELPVWECAAGGLRPLSQRLYDLQPDKIKKHYARIQPAAARVPAGQLLPIGAHDHPEHRMMWTKAELCAIRDYAQRCVDAVAARAPLTDDALNRAVAAWFEGDLTPVDARPKFRARMRAAIEAASQEGGV